MKVVIALIVYMPYSGALFSMACPMVKKLGIEQIHSVSQAAQELAKADENTLVVWDVDYTLLVPETMICWGNSGCVHRNNHRGHEWLPELIEEIFSKSSKSLLHYQSIWYAQEKPVLVEPDMARLIASLQEKKVKTIALTAITSGKHETIPSLPFWRYNKLMECGIDFSKANFADAYLLQLSDAEDNTPLFYKGVLCSGKCSKGKVLSAWLNYCKWRPTRIIAFEDTVAQSRVIVQEMNKEMIHCLGYDYQGAYQLPATLEKDVVRLQLEHLVEYEEWVSRDNARAILGK